MLSCTIQLKKLVEKNLFVIRGIRAYQRFLEKHFKV